MSTANHTQQKYNLYRCRMNTKPGAPLHYDGYVDIWSNSDDRNDLFILAVRELRRTSFPTYSAMMWQMSTYTQLHIG
jgi:hypothetical protein